MNNIINIIVCQQYILENITLANMFVIIAFQKKMILKSMLDKLDGEIYDRKTELEFEYK